MIIDKLIRRNLRRSIDLQEDEQILHITTRHVGMLLLRLALPGGVLLFCIALMIFRIMGGQFLVPDATFRGQFTLVDQVLSLLVLIAIVAGVLLRRLAARLTLLGLGVLFTAWIYFRYNGGRLFAMNTFDRQGLDDASILLVLIAIAALSLCVYIYLDWSNDYLILTNHRVVYDLDQLLLRRVQEQLPLNDIQMVEAETQTYLGHWFNLGTITVRSASFSRAIVYRAAERPREMRAKIMEELKQLEQMQSDADFERLIHDNVYTDNAARAEQAPPIHQSQTTQAFGWLLGDNPIFDPKTRIYTWRPHWFALLVQLVKPMIGLAIMLLLVYVGGQSTLYTTGPALLLAVIAVVIAGLWGAWFVIDHLKEKYILTPVQIVDISKRPFGPENRRTANLESLQNITYKMTVWSRLWGYGDVLLETVGTHEQFTFHNIPNPREVVATVNGYQNAFKKSDQERNIDDTLELLKHYYKSHVEKKS